MWAIMPLYEIFCSAESIRRSGTCCKKENQKQLPKIPLLQSLQKRNHRDCLQSQNLSRNLRGWPCLWWQVGSEAMLSKSFHFFKSWIWLASRIFCLQAKERSWKYWGVWGEKEADLGRGKERLVFFIILRHFFVVLNHFFEYRIWRLKSKVDGVWLRKWPGKKGTWISWPA